jgi:DNA-binding transcriptional regulator YdaS (Cro superfamily)
MTPQELRTICEKAGGQYIVADLIPCSREHLNKMISGRYPITEKTERTIKLLFPNKQHY